MLVTFQRYVHEDSAETEYKWPGVDLAERMRRQLFVEIEEFGDGLKYELVATRDRDIHDALGHFYEIVLDLPEYDGQSPQEVAKHLQQRMYEPMGVIGFFQVGDHRFPSGAEQRRSETEAKNG